MYDGMGRCDYAASRTNRIKPVLTNIYSTTHIQTRTLIHTVLKYLREM